MYLLFSALASGPEAECNEYIDRMGLKVILIILHNVGFLFAMTSFVVKVRQNEKALHITGQRNFVDESNDDINS